MSKKHDDYGHLYSIAVAEFITLLENRAAALSEKERSGFEEDVLNSLLGLRHEQRYGHDADKFLNPHARKRSVRFLATAFAQIRKHYPRGKDWKGAQQAIFIELSKRVRRQAASDFATYLRDAKD